MGNIKLVIIVRMDLGMGKGKIAAQVGHASVTASMNKNSQWINKWLDMGQPKIVLKVPGPVELDQIKKDAITLAVLGVQNAQMQKIPQVVMVCS